MNTAPKARARQPAKHTPARLLLLNKPYDVLSQFTDQQGRATLKDYIPVPGVYPAGRLDRDSEGLLLLTDSGQLQACISHPDYGLEKTYWVQVEGTPSPEQLQQLHLGVQLKDGPAHATQVIPIAPPTLWERTPPVRFRKNIPTSWLAITLDEGRNRQVRRMTAAVGLPTLRLVRIAIGPWQLGNLQPGQWREAKLSTTQKLRTKKRHPLKVPRKTSASKTRG